MHLYEQRHRFDILSSEFLPQFESGGVNVVVASIFLEDRFVSGQALQAGLGQIARLYAEVERCPRFCICRSFDEIQQARDGGKIALIIGMEGAEPLGDDVDRLRIFFELGLRVLSLTHARPNAAAKGAAFSADGSPPEGLSDFGRELVRECERLGIIIDLAHINPAGFDEILQITTSTPIVSHTNARKFYDIDRNLSDEQILAIGRRGGIIGINSILVSPRPEEATIDRYLEHAEHVRELIGINGVAIGFDFFEFLYRSWPESEKANFRRKFPNANFIPDLANHSHAFAVVEKMIARGFTDEEIEKILFGNAMRIFKALL